MPMPSDDVAGDVWFKLLAAAGKARHPKLALWRFVADTGVLPGQDEISEDDVPGGEREAAELRRAALVVAALDVVDRCVDDLQLTGFVDDQRPEPGEAEDSFVYEWFPGRHRGTYDEGFFRKVMVTAVQVAADLVDPQGGPASCTAEEIVRHAVGGIAGELCEADPLGKPWLDPDEYLLEDADFEFRTARTWTGWKTTRAPRPPSASTCRRRATGSRRSTAPGLSTLTSRPRQPRRSCMTCTGGWSRATTRRRSWPLTSRTRRRRWPGLLREACRVPKQCISR